MKRRSFLKLAGACLLLPFLPGGNWLEASAATEAVATTTRVGLPAAAKKHIWYLGNGVYSIFLPATEVTPASQFTIEAGEQQGTINFHDAPWVKK